MRAIVGHHRIRADDSLEGKDTGLSRTIAPGGHRIRAAGPRGFPLLTVEENLETGFAPLKREDRTIPTTCSRCFRC